MIPFHKLIVHYRSEKDSFGILNKENNSICSQSSIKEESIKQTNLYEDQEDSISTFNQWINENLREESDSFNCQELRGLIKRLGTALY